MLLTSQSASQRVAVVLVRDPRVRWAVRAERVARIIPAADWPAGAVDLLAALGPAPRGPRGRVVVVRTGDRETALIAGGAIEIGDFDAPSVLPLPAVLVDRSPEVAAIIVAPDASLSLLFEPAAVAVSDDSVVGEDLCPSRS